MKTRVTLLGVWNVLPVRVWAWLNDDGVKQLQKLTGRKIGVFSYIKDDLNYECFLERDTNFLKKDLDKLSHKNQVKYVKKISDDYFRQAKELEKQLSSTSNLNVHKLTNDQLANEIQSLATAWPKVVMQCWYAVLIDIWYPSQNEKLELKKVIAAARDHCGHLHALSDKIERKLYIEIAKRLNVSLRDVYFMIQPEIIGALRTGKVERSKVRLRMKLYLQTSISGKTQVYHGLEAKALLNKFVVPSVGAKKKGNLTGTPASLGVARGKARVILLDDEFYKFKKGEILVALTTMVHYLPIMKKARAILTEFGGLTSHAAIVSRELKKPAIVGISGLINSIRTGDLVELDARKGEIKILKKAA